MQLAAPAISYRAESVAGEVMPRAKIRVLARVCQRLWGGTVEFEMDIRFAATAGLERLLGISDQTRQVPIPQPADKTSNRFGLARVVNRGSVQCHVA